MRYVKFKRFGGKNFKNHIEPIDITIPDSGITLISGPNGSGKTSIIEILFFTFFGRTPKGLTSNDVVNNQMEKDCVTFVEYDFYEEDGTVDSYKCTRYCQYKSLGNSVVLGKNDIKEFKVGHKEVIKEINKLWSRDVFLNTLFFAQKVKDFFMDLQDSDQKQIFNSILRTHDYASYKEIAKEKGKDTEGKLNDINNNIQINNKLIEDSNNQIERLEKEKEEFYKQKQNRVDSLKSEINNLQEELKNLELEKNNTNISKLKEEYNFLVKAKNDIEYKLSNIDQEKNKELNDLETQVKYKKQEMQSKFNESKNEINNTFNQSIEKLRTDTNESVEQLQNEIDKLTQQYNELNTELNNSIENLRNDLEKEDNNLQEEINNLLSREQELSTKNTELNTNINNIDEDLSNIRKLISGELSECPFCKTNINEHTQQRLQEEINKFETIRDQYEKESEEIQNIMEDVDAQKDVKRREKQKLKEDFEKDKKSLELSYQEKMDSITEDKLKKEREKQGYKDNFEAGKKSLESENTKQVNDLEKKLKEKFSQVDELHKQWKKETEDKYSKEKSDLQTQLDEKTSQINKVEDKINNYNDIVNRIDNINNNLNTKNENLKEKESEEFDENQISYYKNKIEEYNNQITSLRNEYENLKFRYEILEFWRKGFSNSGIPSMLIDEAIPFMNRTIREYLDDMTYGRYTVTFDTLKQNKSGDFKDKISVDVFDNVTKANQREQFSGGQSRLIDIATILTLSDLQSYIQNLQTNLLIFDEVFDALDDDNIGLVSKSLRKISEEKSIIIISHKHIDQLETEELLQLYN